MMTGNALHKQYIDESVSNYDAAYGATTGESSIKTKSRKSWSTCKKSKDKDDGDSANTKECKQSKKKKEMEKKKNDWPHCKKYHRCRPHPNVPKEKFF